MGIKHADLHALHIGKACQGSLAGIAGGGCQDQDILLHIFNRLCLGQQLGQHAQGHILKSRGRTPEQLQNRKLAGIHCGGQLPGLKFAGVGLADKALHIRDIRQHRADDPRCHCECVLLQAGLYIHFRQALRYVQTAVGGKTVKHRLGTVYAGKIASCGVVLHNCPSFLRHMHKRKGDRIEYLVFLALLLFY